MAADSREERLPIRTFTFPPFPPDTLRCVVIVVVAVLVDDD